MSTNSKTCVFDHLPTELLYTLFTYFLAHEIFLIFVDVSDRVNAVVREYSAYHVNFKSIRKTSFDLICHRIHPEQVISLTLCDDKDTPGLSKMFLSRFRIEQFVKLRSLKLIEIEYESVELILSNLHKLDQLHSFSFNVNSIRKKYPTRSNHYTDISKKIDLLLSSIYPRVLPQVNRLYLHSGHVLHSIVLLSLHYLKLDTCSLDELKVIFKNALQLQSLAICLKLQTPNLDISSTSSRLTRLDLKIENCPISMNEMEYFLPQLPYLKHVKLDLKGSEDLCNGYRWQKLTSDYTTFLFRFHITLMSVNEKLRSFRTSFWLEEKRLFVNYKSRCLYAEPHTRNNVLNGYSQVSHSKAQHNSVDQRKEMTHLHVDSIFDLLECIPLEYKFPYIRECEMVFVTIVMLEKIKGYQFQQIQKLDIYIECEAKNLANSIKTLAHIFPSLKHLIITYSEDFSIEHMVLVVKKFKYIENISFHYKCLPFSETIIYDHQKLITLMTWRLVEDNFTCRIFHSSEFNELNGIHWWIRAEPIKSFGIGFSLSHLKLLWKESLFILSEGTTSILLRLLWVYSILL
ncbi:hypothetical protein I4U23_022958 [Adineta vaga]|nr:hypothetical protein I4U23_022958 [Adineta vaga]